MVEYKEEWTHISIYDFRGSLRGQGKRYGRGKGRVVIGGMFDRSCCSLIESKTRWGNYPLLTQEERELLIKGTALQKITFDKVMTSTGDKNKAILAMCEV